MTHDDLIALANKRLADDERVATHWVGCETDHDLCLIYKLSAAIRELEAELAERLTVDEARDGSEAIFHWHERAERAEAERDALRAENERLRAALRNERERCAKVCEAEAVENAGMGDEEYNMATRHCADAIRALEETP
jgi:hypothetical protein